MLLSSFTVFILPFFTNSSSPSPCCCCLGMAQALERQREFSDAGMRDERDKLRDQVVHLKDALKVQHLEVLLSEGFLILTSKRASMHMSANTRTIGSSNGQNTFWKIIQLYFARSLPNQKNGIVLSPEVTTNGEAGQMIDGPLSTDSTSRLAQESQPSHGGESMLGKKITHRCNCSYLISAYLPPSYSNHVEWYCAVMFFYLTCLLSFGWITVRNVAWWDTKRGWLALFFFFLTSLFCSIVLHGIIIIMLINPVESVADSAF